MRLFQSPSLRGSGRFSFARLRCSISAPTGFNPLHCGAVVASRRRAERRAARRGFQSPSLRGSGRFLEKVESDADGIVFQSPSLRGSGRFRRGGARRDPEEAGFNPLHCGAVVASTDAEAEAGSRRSCFNPLHCGAVVASRESLRKSWIETSFNPLHCGAVVASCLTVAIFLVVLWWGFNPLHCGAVVASSFP